MTHVTATIPKMRFFGSSVSFHTVENSLAAIYSFSVFISSKCFFSQRDLLLSPVAASLHYLPLMFAFNNHMQQNAYCRNLSEPLLQCHCYPIKANFKTILPQVLQATSAGNVADLVNCKLISHQPKSPQLKYLKQHVVYVFFYKNHICCFLSMFKKKQTHCTYVVCVSA